MRLNLIIFGFLKNMLGSMVLKSRKNIKVINLLLSYRYFSLIITCFLYWFMTPNKIFILKLIIVFGLIMACGVLSYMYIQNHNDRAKKLTLIIVETIENSLLIIISGGFASPFIWYFISTVFIAAVELSHYTAIISACVYFVIACATTFFRIFPFDNHNALTLYINIAFSYILVVVAIMQLVEYAIRVEEKSTCLADTNSELKEAKQKIEKALAYCLDIYETVNIFNLDKNKNVLLELLNQIQHLTKVDQIVFLRLTPFNKIGGCISCGFSKKEEEEMAALAIKQIEDRKDQRDFLFCEYKGEVLPVYIITYDQNPCGAIIAKADENWLIQESIFAGMDYFPQENEDKTQYNVIAVFLKIAGIVLKKLEIDEMSELLLISEEQNRIANEIHDIVLQKLFAASCKIYVLSEGSSNYTADSMKNELMQIKQSIDLTMRELREAIYGFAWEKEGEDIFRKKLIRYASEIKNLHGIEVSTEIVGDTQRIRVNQKVGLYRVICEAINNAIRHGRAKNIYVKVEIGDTFTTVKITDDGYGFDYNEYLKKNDKGLGIGNIHRVIGLLNGHVEMSSSLAGGTEILLSIPYEPAA